MASAKTKPSVPAGRIRPSLTFDSLTFSDSTKIALASDDIVVLVGPNNSGKSLALRELEALVGKNARLKVLHGASVRRVGSEEEVIAEIKENSTTSGALDNRSYVGYRYSIPVNLIHVAWNRGPLHNLKLVAPYFCARIPTETRITDSNPLSNIALPEAPAQHPIHLLQADDRVEARISSLFRRAFGQDLIVYHAGGNQVPLFAGTRPTRLPSEDRISATYLARIRSQARPLQEQGDGMRSFATVILNMLALDNRSIVLLDEPEAFLHPPQARLLGEIIARETPAGCQLFVATHSADVLQGLLTAEGDRLRILRIQRTGDVNHVKELDRTKTAEIARDPLLKYSQVFDAIFYQHVFICEADSDCLFYGSLSQTKSMRKDEAIDAIFIHANGKHRMARVARALRSLDVPVSAIVDVDIVSEEDVFRDLFTSLGGDWSSVAKDYSALKTAVEARKPHSTAAETINEIRRLLKGIPAVGQFPSDRRRRIEQLLRKASPWDLIKQAGKAAIPPGQASQQYSRIEDAASSVRLWIVPAGEMEGFCRTAEGRKGPGWVQQVLETRNLRTDRELAGARAFMRAIWSKAARTQ